MSSETGASVRPHPRPFTAVLRTLIILSSLLALAACGGGGDGGGGGETVTVPTAILSATADGVIYEIDPDTGAQTELVDTALGEIVAMAFAPGGPTLYGGVGQSALGDCDDCFYKKIDDSTGNPDLIAQISGGGILEDLTVNRANGRVYGTFSTECPWAAEIDTTTGDLTSATSYSCSDYALGLSYDGSGQLYTVRDRAAGDRIGVLDPVAETDTPVANISYVSFPAAAPQFVQSLTAHPTSGQLVGLTDAGDLATVDQCSGTVSYVATPTNPVISIALVGSAPLPYPGVCGAFAVGDSGAFAQFYADLSWRDYPVADTYTIFYSIDATGIDPSDPGTYDGTVPGLTSANFTFTFNSYGVPSGSIVYFKIGAVVGGAVVGDSDEVPMLYVQPPA